MKIQHRYTTNLSIDTKLKFKSLGLNVDEGLVTVVVDESNERWPEIHSLMQNLGAVDIVGTKFTSSELLRSNHLAIFPSWHNGYPQPEVSYLQTTFDLNEYCTICGIGKRQKAPFVIKNEPVWNNRILFSLFWVFDEIFVNNDYYHNTISPLGIDCRDVIIKKSNSTSSSVVQLVIPEVNIPLENINTKRVECPNCNRVKYYPHTRGYFPRLADSVNIPIFKTLEYFGSGAAADKRIIVNSQVRDLLMDANAKVTFYPCRV
jgi:hypothetical protein